MSDSAPIRGEEDLVQTYLAPLAGDAPGAFGLADDCAVLAPRAGYELVLKTDALAEGVHYLPGDPPELVGWKALAVNVSDLAAKGAEPLGYLLSLAFPAAPSRAWMEAFAAGLRAGQQVFGMTLLGGDTDRRPGPTSITPMVIGQVPAGRMVRRATAMAGDRLYVSGTLGDAALGLELLRVPNGPLGTLDDAAKAHLIDRYRRPVPRLGLRDALRAEARAAMDISDGLAKDLGRMCRASGVGARVELAALPLSAAAASALRVAPHLDRAIVSAGDDYEVLAAVPPASASGFECAAHQAGVPVARIGICTPGHDVTIVAADGAPIVLAREGWDHF